MEASKPEVTLHTGAKMPLIGLGTWKVEKELCADIVYQAIKVGYRCIDEAMVYGNEKEAGAGNHSIASSWAPAHPELESCHSLDRRDIA